jgi:outer membrane lipoprotein carrier protein
MREKLTPRKGFGVCLGLVLLAWWFFTTPEAFAGDAKSAEQIVNALQKNYDATADFVADFRQETEVRTLDRSLKAWGKLYFKRPGKMLWRYAEPKGQLVLMDGSHLYFLQPEQNQVIKSPLQNAFRSDIPLSFLLGIGKLKKDFNVRLEAAEKTQYVLRLEPKGDTGGFSEIQIGVNSETFDITWARIRDAASNLTTIRFSEIKKERGLSDSLFRLQIPNGMDVVELGQ